MVDSKENYKFDLGVFFLLVPFSRQENLCHSLYITRKEKKRRGSSYLKKAVTFECVQVNCFENDAE